MLKPINQETKKRGVADSCRLCAKKFNTLSAKEHQCKRCLSAICSACGPSRYPVYEVTLEKEDHRVCLRCKSEIEWLQMTSAETVLSFNRNSSIAERWVNLCDSRGYEIRLKQYNEVLNSPGEEAIKCRNYCKVKLKAELLPSLSYSFRELLAVSLRKSSLQAIFTATRNVAMNVLNFIQMEFMPSQLHLVLFILCFLDEVNASSMLRWMYKQLTTLAHPTNRPVVEKGLQNIIAKQLVRDSADQQRIWAVAEILLPDALVSGLINWVTPSVSLMMLSNWLAKGSADQLLRMLLSISFILKDCNQDLQLTSLRKIDKKNLKGRIDKCRSQIFQELKNIDVLQQYHILQNPGEKEPVLLRTARTQAVVTERVKAMDNRRVAELQQEITGLKKLLEEKDEQLLKVQLNGASAKEDQTEVKALEKKVAELEEDSWRYRKFQEQIDSLVGSFSQVINNCTDSISQQLYFALAEVNNTRSVVVQSEEDRSVVQRNHQLCQKLIIASKAIEQKREQIDRLQKKEDQLKRECKDLEERLRNSEKARTALKHELTIFENLGGREEDFISNSQIYEAIEQSQKVNDLQTRYIFEQFIKRSKTISDHLKYVCLELKIKRERIEVLQNELQESRVRSQKLQAALSKQLEVKMQSVDQKILETNQQILSSLALDQPRDECKQF